MSQFTVKQTTKDLSLSPPVIRELKQAFPVLDNLIPTARLSMDGLLELDNSSPNFLVLDPVETNQDLVLPPMPSIGMWFIIKNLSGFNLFINVKETLTGFPVVQLGYPSGKSQLFFIYDGYEWNIWG